MAVSAKLLNSTKTLAASLAWTTVVATVVVGAGYLLIGNLMHSMAVIVFGLPVILGITMMQKGWQAKHCNAPLPTVTLTQALILSLLYVCCGISFSILGFLTAVYWPDPWTASVLSTFIYICVFACFQMALKEYKAFSASDNR